VCLQEHPTNPVAHFCIPCSEAALSITLKVCSTQIRQLRKLNKVFWLDFAIAVSIKMIYF
jgi:hypothetical protein